MRDSLTAALLAALSLCSGSSSAAESRGSGPHAAAPGETMAPRLQIPLGNIPGHTFTSAVVTFPPGARAAPHRHGQAFVYAYVLAGAVRSQVDDGPAKVYHAGEDWFEAPGAIHQLTENSSRHDSARLLVVFVAPTGAALKTAE